MNDPIADRATARTSLRQQLVELEIGQSVCLAEKLDQNKAKRSDLADADERLHNTARSAMARATRDSSQKYTGESGQWRTGVRQGADPVVCFLITRTA